MDLPLRLLRFVIKYIVSWILILYSMTVGLFIRKGRRFLATILNLYGVTCLTRQPSVRLPRISHNRVIQDAPVEIIEPHSKDGNVRLDELAIINGIIKKENPGRIFEIGTFDGRTTLNMAYSSRDDCEIFTLDLPGDDVDRTKYEIGHYDKTLIDMQISGERITKSDLACKNKIRQLTGDSATFDFTPYYNTVQLVFIDGAHNYTYVLEDSETALRLIGNGEGVILWHDYKDDFPVAKAIVALMRVYPDLKIFNIQETSLAYCKKV